MSIALFRSFVRQKSKKEYFSPNGLRGFPGKNACRPGRGYNRTRVAKRLYDQENKKKQDEKNQQNPADPRDPPALFF